MQRIICDQVVRCMDKHNRNIFEKKLDISNEMNMRAYVELLLKHGRIPVVTVKDVKTVETETIYVKKSKTLSEKCAFGMYTNLCFVENNEMVEYATIANVIASKAESIA